MKSKVVLLGPQKAKVVLLGPQKAGKTKLRESLVTVTYTPFSEDYKPTIGADFTATQNFNLWEVGSFTPESMWSFYLKDAEIVVFVIDSERVTNKQAKNDIKNFFALVDTNKEKLAPNARIGLVVTKTDTIENQNLHNLTTEAQTLITSLKETYPELPWTDEVFYCSAKNGDTQKLFDTLLCKKEEEKEKEDLSTKRTLPYPADETQEYSTGFITWSGFLRSLTLLLFLSAVFLVLGGIIGGVESEWLNLHDFFIAVYSTNPWAIGVLAASFGLALAIVSIAVIFSYYRQDSADDYAGADNTTLHYDDDQHDQLPHDLDYQPSSWDWFWTGKSNIYPEQAVKTENDSDSESESPRIKFNHWILSCF
jgi:GTPase SAR1 family protein/cbb3-type cytochrome oxidase subunit 3